ncbi:hypothetical protein [Blastococcus sp. SYSU D00813]
MGAESTVTFLRRPKPVEVLHRDRWWIGALLGWRHDADGTCWLRVTALVEGYKRTAWVGMDTVRLPLPPGRPDRPAAPARTADDDEPRTQRLPRHGDRGVRSPLPALPRPRPEPGRTAGQVRPARV